MIHAAATASPRGPRTVGSKYAKGLDSVVSWDLKKVAKHALKCARRKKIPARTEPGAARKVDGPETVWKSKGVLHVRG